jgi:hypothetical protein
LSRIFVVSGVWVWGLGLDGMDGVCISRELLGTDLSKTDLSKIRRVLNGKFECFLELTRSRISLRLE